MSQTREKVIVANGQLISMHNYSPIQASQSLIVLSSSALAIIQPSVDNLTAIQGYSRGDPHERTLRRNSTLARDCPTQPSSGPLYSEAFSSRHFWDKGKDLLSSTSSTSPAASWLPRYLQVVLAQVERGVLVSGRSEKPHSLCIH